jgi:flagellar motility protein MotE (MotC chaperone)
MMRVALPRLLPLTTFALAALLAMKSAELVRDAVAADDKPAATPAVVNAAPAAPAPAPAAEPAPVSDGEKAVLLELRHRREQLDTREAGLAQRESVLAAAEQKIATRIGELQALQKHLEELDAARKQREDASWQGLVKLYEAMKPRDAATIFDDLDMPVLLQVVDRMKEAKAAPILAAMHPDKARDLTAQLAQMRTRREGQTGG